MKPTSPALYRLQQALSIPFFVLWIAAFAIMTAVTLLIVVPVRWVVDNLDNPLMRLLYACALPTITIGICKVIGAQLPDQLPELTFVIVVALYIVLTFAAVSTREESL